MNSDAQSEGFLFDSREQVVFERQQNSSPYEVHADSVWNSWAPTFDSLHRLRLGNVVLPIACSPVGYQFHNHPIAIDNTNMITETPRQWPKKTRKPCSIEGCPNKAVSRAVCISHGAIQRKKCSTQGCVRNAVQKGVCISHGARPRKSCSIEGCKSQAVSKRVCSKHGAKRTKCSFPECSRFAQRLGKCFSHGASAGACTFQGCKKQSKKGGVCSAHGAKRGRKQCENIGCKNQAVRNRVCVAHGANDRRCATENCCRFAVLGDNCTQHALDAGKTLCGYRECEEIAVKNGRCIHHAQVFRICRVDGCNEYAARFGHCLMHRSFTDLDTDKAVKPIYAPQPHELPFSARYPAALPVGDPLGWHSISNSLAPEVIDSDGVDPVFGNIAGVMDVETDAYVCM